MYTKLNSEIDLLVEASWEVCNKIGGIYAVLSTKAAELKAQFGDKVVFLGPDVWTKENPSPDFIERKMTLKRAWTMQLPFEIKVRCGKWNIPGSPNVVLIDFKGVYNHLDEIYGKMWEEYKVDSLHSYGDYNEACAFAVACAIVTKALAAHLKVRQEATVAHFNEWTTGMGLLYLKSIMPQAATLFTTHATTIGRSICGNGKPLYDYFEGYNGDQMANELNVESKHSLEKAAAHQADCFTTVSEVTGKECTQLLDITPAVITPNGFEPSFVPDSKKLTALRKQGREKILNIAKGLTGENFPEDTYIVATSGRNEFRNKGLDLYIDTMVELGKLAKENPRKIIALILVPAWVSGPNTGLLTNLTSDSFTAVHPSYMTHRLHNEDSDAIACRLRERIASVPAGEKNVTFIYVPCYLDGNDGIVNISYYDLLPAIDASLFGSYYEPWGYTPMESVAFGVPTITTDKAGFGQWVQENIKSSLEDTGVLVVPRTDSGYPVSLDAIAYALLNYYRATPKEVTKARRSAMFTAEKAEWKYFIKAYFTAFGIALKNAAQRKRQIRKEA